MPVRVIDAQASDFAAMNGAQLAESIAMAEGRTIGAEVISTYESPVEGVSKGEICAAMGADMIIFDRYDCHKPIFHGAPETIQTSQTPLRDYGRLVGLPVGVNIIVAEASAQDTGQYYNVRNFETLVQQGVDIVFIYAIADEGGTIKDLCTCIRDIRSKYGDEILLVAVPFYTLLPDPDDDAHCKQHAEALRAVIDAGSQMICLATPGTSQGWRSDQTAKLVDLSHRAGGLVWSVITGSIEGSPPDVIHRLALENKMLGIDAVRVDEAGLSGMPLPESVYEFSLALRGKRHTYRRMASSPLR